ncbi:MAG: hypothetical protein FGM14_07215 [Flavobacteriales bacterium]|nr:hypothetical protein [Flavobacteriales bacterium]
MYQKKLTLTNPKTTFLNLQRQTHFSVSSEGVPIRNIADYSPFGVQLDGRTIQGDFYRYGYQGSEKDDESKGGGNSYTTYYRQLDPRVGRWFSIDPVFQPWQSPYYSMDGNPIMLNDPKGDKVKFGRYKKDKSEHAKFATRKEFNNAKRELKKSIDELKKESQTFKQMYEFLDDQKEIYTVFGNNDKGSGDFYGNNLNFGLGDMTSESGFLNENTFDRETSLKATLGHEFGHAWREAMKFDVKSSTSLEYFKPIYFSSSLIEIKREEKIKCEMDAVHIENIVRSELIERGKNLKLKSNYYGSFPQAQKTKNGKYQAIFEYTILKELDANKEKYLKGEYKLKDIEK